MEIRRLENELRTLIEVEETESPVVSYFYNCEDPDASHRMREQLFGARKALEPGQREAFDRALDRIQDHVPWEVEATTRSVAVFARGGSSPLFHLMEFQAELDTRLVVDGLPAVYPLVELKDNYHRYVLMICTEESARILEVSLGSVTREIWTRRPELRRRVGREWTRLHYQNHRRDRRDRFVKEKIARVERIFAAGGHSHLMLAGSTRIVARVRGALPRALAERLVDVVPASARDRSEDVVLATLSSFVEHEERESQSMVDQLRQELLRGGLAVCGFGESRAALAGGRADVLVLLGQPDAAADSGHEELVRLAVHKGVQVEVVRQSEALAELGGVGCLLRYETWTVGAAAVGSAA